MPSEKILGYLFLFLGVLIMIFSSFQLIKVFTGTAEPVAIFSQPKKTMTNKALVDTGGQDQLKMIELIQKDPFSLLSDTNSSFNPFASIMENVVIYDVLNLLTHFVVMQFLLSLGFKFANIGVGLLRPINVTVSQKRIDSAIDNIT